MPAGSPMLAFIVVQVRKMMFAGLAVVVSVPCPRSTMRFESLKFHTAIESAFTVAAEERQKIKAREASSRRGFISFPFCEKVGLDRTKGRLPRRASRSEEHTSELQSPCNLVCRLLLEKKNQAEAVTAAAVRISVDKSRSEISTRAFCEEGAGDERTLAVQAERRET